MKLLNFFTALIINFFIGATIAGVSGFDPVSGGAVAVGAAGVFSLFQMPSLGVLDVALLQMWERAVIERFIFEHSWMQRVPSKDEYVGNDIINLTEIGARPDVLIDNTDYPIPIQDIKDDNIPVSLKKFQTKATRVTDDEVYALPYDKEGSLFKRHLDALEEMVANCTLHAFAPDEDKPETPVVKTTGDVVDGRKRLKSADIISLKARWDAKGYPKKGRILSLCTEHVQDLLLEDRSFRDQYHNVNTGMIAKNYYGFEIYEDVYNPLYDGSFEKQALSAAETAASQNASVAFHTGRVFKARGSVKAYYSPAEPKNQQSLFNYRLYFIGRPTKTEAVGAIVSDKS